MLWDCGLLLSSKLPLQRNNQFKKSAYCQSKANQHHRHYGYHNRRRAPACHKQTGAEGRKILALFIGTAALISVITAYLNPPSLRSSLSLYSHGQNLLQFPQADIFQVADMPYTVKWGEPIRPAPTIINIFIKTRSHSDSMQRSQRNRNAPR